MSGIGWYCSEIGQNDLIWVNMIWMICVWLVWCIRADSILLQVDLVYKIWVGFGWSELDLLGWIDS